MLEMLNTTAAMILALALLLVAVAAPFLLVWIALSIRRDMRRIADSVDDIAGKRLDLQSIHDKAVYRAGQGNPRPVSNSMFGR